MSGDGYRHSTHTTTGRLVRTCAHRDGWATAGGGVRRCVSCGVERYGSYGALRLPEDEGGLGGRTGTERAVAAATAVAVLGTRFLEARARLLRRRPYAWTAAA
ncbi:DUF6255 family natural product biosynthesis protein [Streptomyces sp. I05A-00742]|uniref:DUF6255 family natural product biosynthesis protein n=1 Tax=Streptomyces sp. I05A-00742 TaxID=2732853 RepID=UPI001488DE74|nr:DUF6255 family natural product biosynthesis protein [Streptomyces sp. I05A-00742]